jgi:hypothetical protein
MVNSYQLVNPHIAGTFDTKIKAKNSKEASNIFYKNLSEHFSNSIPQFFFTIQKGGSGNGKFFHFKAEEERNEDEVSFKISSYELQNENKIDAFKNNLNEIKDKIQGGGKKGRKGRKSSKSRKSRKNDSSDSSDSENGYLSDDIYSRASSYIPTTPMYYWWYDPSLYDVKRIYIPSFYSYMTPYIQVSLS